MKKILLGLLVTGAVAGVAFVATNAFFSDTETSKDNKFQAGAVDLTIDSTAHYDGMVCTAATDGDAPYVWQNDGSVVGTLPRPELIGQPCDGTWPEGNLTSEKFYNLEDVKPGDWGENTISVHVEDNPVWACIDINNLFSAENGINDPEAKAGDVTPTTGELAQNLYFTAWGDTDCNNKFDGNEQLMFSNKQGPASDVLDGKTYALADSTTGGVPFDAKVTKCVGLQWCAGTMTIGEDHTITCNGSTMGNESQTDSLTADVAFRVVQSRNNPDFVCSRPEGVTYGHISLENKDSNWSIIANDNTYGDIQYSTNDHTFNGTVTGTGLVPGGYYQITLNGPGVCTFTDDSLAKVGPNAFSSGYWNDGVNLEPTCNNGTSGQGVYNMNLVSDWYTFTADGSGDFSYPFDLNLPAGDYVDVKVLVKKMLDTHVSPWVDLGGAYPTFNLYETAPISFTVL